jgi:DNA polymerase III subunit gamma/tau
MALNIKYRPKTFKQFFGNSPTVKSLQGILEKEEKPHAFFLSGPSGCGKTTLSRIIANELECNENDLHEINMSNNRGIDTARDIISKAFFKPLYGKTKVYLLDESHRATVDFQNALLKIVEEPPEHAYFIFCTTEPEKIIETIKNRCACYQVALLPLKRIKKLLEYVCEKEKISIGEKHLKQISIASAGSPRQALLILEQVRNLEPENISKSIRSYAEKDKADIKKLCQALLQKKSWKIVSAVIKNIEAEPETIRRAVLGYMSAVMLNLENEQAVIVIENFANNFYDSGKAGLVLACYESIV